MPSARVTRMGWGCKQTLPCTMLCENSNGEVDTAKYIRIACCRVLEVW